MQRFFIPENTARSAETSSSYSKYTSPGYSSRTTPKDNDSNYQNVNSKVDHHARSYCPFSFGKDCPGRDSNREKSEASDYSPRDDGKICHKKTSSRNANTSLEEQEYLQFLLRITEDIIKNDMYSNKEMKRIFTSHLKANSKRLEMDRMLLRIHELMKELNIPLANEKEENSASWSDIASSMRRLLRLDDNKTKENKNEDYSEPKPKGKCICFDLKNAYPVVNPEEKPANKEDVDNSKNEAYTASSKFQSSLDRLTEHTEPFSSRATCKVSTSFPNFQDVDVLPGFECLETPKVSKGVLCNIYGVEKGVYTFLKRCSGCQKRKFRVRTHSFKKRKKKGHPKVKQDAPLKMESKKIKKRKLQCKLSNNKFNGKPIIITIQENEKSLNNELIDKDYILIQGPVYVLKTFLEKNPEIMTTNTIPSPPVCPVKPKIKHKNPNNLNKNEIDNIVHTDEKADKDFIQDIQNMLLEFLNLTTSQENLPEVEENNNSCATPCPQEPICERTIACAKNQDIKPEEYDLTPQKEHQTDAPTHVETATLGTTQIVLDDFLKTTEIQTEDLPKTPTIVGAALVYYKDESVLGSTEYLEENYSTDTLRPDPSKEDQQAEQDTHTPPPDTHDFFEYEKEMNDPKYNMLMTAAKHDDSLNKGNSIPKMLDSKTRQLGRSSENSTVPTLASTATVELTKQYLALEDQQKKPLSPTFVFLNGPQDASKSESGDLKHQRRVSILKNPIQVQPPPEKIVNDTEDPKKMGEAIIRTVESLKDRQPVRDPYLDRVIQEIESSRETRPPDKWTPSTDVSESTFAAPGPSRLKNPTRYANYHKNSYLDDDPSYDELPLRTIHAGRANVGTVAAPPSSAGESSDAESEQNFLSHLDERSEIKGPPSQIVGPAKLEMFRKANEKEEAEISTTLDKLVETLKEQQQKDDDTEEKPEEHDDQKPAPTGRKYPRICCGLCRKKRVVPIIPYVEAAQANAFSEEEYKAKSEAFEQALAGLGQRTSEAEEAGQLSKEQSPMRLRSDDDDRIERRSSRIVHTGHRMSFVRIADDRELDENEGPPSDYEIVSSRVSSNRIRYK